MGEMFNPPHPGLILKDTVLREDGGISVKEFAEKFPPCQCELRHLTSTI